jgi:hypothetical protein
VKLGAIYWVDLGTTHPPECGKASPGVVVFKLMPGCMQAKRRSPFSRVPGRPRRRGFFWGGQSYAVDEEHMCRIDGAHDAYLSE